MIVTCEECSTSFQLDEARIPATGAQVRCSRCKHAFFLPNPSASQADTAHSIAEQAAGDSMAGVPPVASDVAEPDAVEEDWEFNQEVRIEGDESLDSIGDSDDDVNFSDDLDADALMDELSPEDLEADLDSAVADEPDLTGLQAEAATEGESGLDLGSKPDASSAARDESAFGSVDDFSSLMEDDDVAPVDLAAESESDIGIESSEGSEVANAGVYASSGSTDDLGDPESWDLVGSDGPASQKTAIGALGRRLDDQLAGVDLGFGDEDELVYDDETRRASPILSGLGRIGSLAGWVVTLVLVGGIVGLGLKSEWNRWIASPQSVSAAGVSAETDSIRWVETSRAGFVMVVEGQVRNTTGSARRPGRIQLALLDFEGRRLAAHPILAGEPLSPRALRESTPEALRDRIDAATSHLYETELAPGSVRAFTMIAREDDLPEQARRVLLEISNEPLVPVDRSDSVEAESGALDATGEAEDVSGDGSGNAAADAGMAVDGGKAQVDEESDFSP